MQILNIIPHGKALKKNSVGEGTQNGQNCSSREGCGTLRNLVLLLLQQMSMFKVK